MANDTCPHCGAECGPGDLRYGCGTLHQSSGIDGRSEGCLKTEASQLRNQLATVTAERDELRRRIDEAPVICSEGMTENDAYEVVEREWSEHPESTFRLVRDDQPEETVK